MLLLKIICTAVRLVILASRMSNYSGHLSGDTLGIMVNGTTLRNLCYVVWTEIYFQGMRYCLRFRTNLAQKRSLNFFLKNELY